MTDVVVTAVDVRVGVMRHVVLDPPRITAEPEQRISGPAKQMVVARLPKVRTVVCVVLNAQRGQRHAARKTGKASNDHPELVRHQQQDGPRDPGRCERDNRLRVETQKP